MSRPAWRIFAIVLPAGMLRGSGSGPRGRRLARGSQAAGAAPALADGAGSRTLSGRAGSGDAALAGRGAEAQAASPASATRAATIPAMGRRGERGSELIGTPQLGTPDRYPI